MSRPRLARCRGILATSLFLSLASGPLYAETRAPDPSSLMANLAPPLSARAAAQAPGGVLAFDGRESGAPRPFVLRAREGATLTGPSSLPVETIAREALASQVSPAGDLVLVSSVRAGGGVQYLSFEQQFEGIPVSLGRVSVAVLENGAVLAIIGGELSPSGPVERRGAPALTDPLSARDAAVAALRWPGASVASAQGEHLDVERVWLPTRHGAEPVWRVRVGRLDRLEAQAEVILGEQDGRVRKVTPRTFEIVSGGRVFRQNPLQPAEMVAFVDGMTT